MEGLADEIVLDAVVKEAFFSTGDVFFEIAQYFVQTAAAAGAEETTTLSGSNLNAGGVGNKRKSGEGEKQKDAGRVTTVADVRRFAAATAVLDSAFFHSLQVPGRINLVSRPMPVSLPVVAGLLVEVYASLCRRLSRCRDDHDGGELTRENERGKAELYLDFPSVEAYRRRGEAGVGHDGAASVARAYDAMDAWVDLSTQIQDRVVRAINGMSDVSMTRSVGHGSIHCC